MRAGVSCESHIKGYYDENLSGKAFVRFHFLTCWNGIIVISSLCSLYLYIGFMYVSSHI